MSTPPDKLYDMFFNAATKVYDLPDNLLKTVARFESNFNPEALSPKGAVGLMQIVPSMHPNVDPTDPYESIDYAGKWLSELHEQFGSWELALAAYNAGPGTVERFDRKSPSEWPGYDETKNYVSNILGNLDNVPDGPIEQDIFSRMWNEGGADSGKSPYHHLLPEEGGSTYVRRSPDLGDLPFIGEHIVKASEKLLGPQDRSKYVREQQPLGSPGLLQWLAPTTRGVNAAKGTVSFVRRLSPFRKRGVQLAEEVAKVAEKTAPASKPTISGAVNKDLLGRIIPDKGADEAVSRVFQKGYEFWKGSLGGMNPSEVQTYINSLSGAERLVAQRGSLLALQENLANMGRLTTAAQRQLLSPAGQARLAETFRGMPPEYITHFNKLVEKGQYQRVTRFAFLAGIAFQAARRFGRDILEYVGLGSGR